MYKNLFAFFQQCFFRGFISKYRSDQPCVFHKKFLSSKLYEYMLHEQGMCIPCGVNVPRSPALQKETCLAAATFKLKLSHAACKNKLGSILWSKITSIHLWIQFH